MKVLDVNPFHSGIARNMTMLDRLEIEMNNIEKAVDGLVGMEDTLKGEGGSAIRSFYKECHLPLIQFFRVSQRNLKSTLNAMDNALDGLEPDDNGFISQAYLEEEVEEGLTEIAQITSNLTDEANRIMNQVSDIISLPNLDDTDVQEGIQRAKKKRDTTVTELNEFDATQTQALGLFENDLETMATWLSTLESVFKDGLTDVDFQRGQWATLTEKSTLKTDLEQRQGGVDEVPPAEEEENRPGIVSPGVPLGYKTYLEFLNNLKDENLVRLPSKLYMENKLSPDQKRHFRKTGNLSFLTKEEFRKYNNLLSLDRYKYNSKELIEYIKEHKTKAFAKGNLKGLMQEWEPFGKERGKNAMIKEFSELYGLDKYREFNKLTPSKKVTTTFVDKFVGDSFKTVKSTLDSAKEWKDPKTAINNSMESIKKSGEEFKKANPLNKTGKVVGKSLGPLSWGLIVNENVSEYKGDKQKIAVGIAVDGVSGAAITAVGAAIGTAVFPGVGTAAGAVIGATIGVSIGLMANMKFGEPPKSAIDNTKDFVNSKVNTAKKACKELGGKISSWFK